VSLLQRWGKVTEQSPNDETRERARISAVETQGFTRMVQRKSLIWKRDSLARTMYGPKHMPDCNVKATVGKHFLFNEPIPRSENGQGYLRVTRFSLWWQQREFPNVWTSEGLTTCVEKGYRWSINSTTWNHLQAMWQGPSLDLLSQVYEETQHQDRIEACGYRSATWRILRALKSINQAKVMVGESAITAAAFFESAGRPSKFFWGPQQGKKVILRESLSAGGKEESLKVIQKEKGWVI
jgi:hypothetical protein